MILHKTQVMKNTSLLLLFLVVLLTSCKSSEKGEVKQPATFKQLTPVEAAILNNPESFYYIDRANYPKERNTLPVGVFDSGTGGLTVFDAIVNFDGHNNQTGAKGSDGKLDFASEKFIYLADQANMPYGNYSKEKNVALLKEHILKDAQFLLSDKYYESSDAKQPKTDKEPVKTIVIACNTATAYGKQDIEDLMTRLGLKIKVIGVIDAGVRGALESFEKDENGIVGIMATAGTVASNGYVNTLKRIKDEQGYTGKIETFQQGGVGIAGAVDEDPDFYDKNLKAPRENYKGPALEGDLMISKALLDIYNFDFSGSKMLCDNEKVDDCSVMQINDPENYVRYHVVSLMEKIKSSNTNNKLKAVILGCTHYPYLIKTFRNTFTDLYNYKDKDGVYRYRDLMAPNIKLIDPSVNTAKELYEYMQSEQLFNPSGNMDQSEFYISVANKDNKNVDLTMDGRFTYNYKYHRKAGEVQEYVKVVPFSKRNISDDILGRLKVQIPNVYRLIVAFDTKNSKTSGLKEAAIR